MKSLFDFLSSFKQRLFPNILEISLILLLGLFPFRLISLFVVNFYVKFFIGILGFLTFVYFKNKLFKWLFNNKGFQFFFYSCLWLENFLFFHILILFSLCLWIGYLIPLDSFLFMVLLFFFNFYFRFKSLVLNLEFTDDSLGLEKPEDLTWQQFIASLNFFVKKTYNGNVLTKLPSSYNATAFPFIVRRFMFKRAARHLHEFSFLYPVIGGGLAGSGAVIGFGLKYEQKEREIKMTYEVQKMTAQGQLITAEGQLITAKANAEYILAKAERLKIENQQKQLSWFNWFSKKNNNQHLESSNLGGNVETLYPVKGGSQIKAPSVLMDDSHFYLLSL